MFSVKILEGFSFVDEGRVKWIALGLVVGLLIGAALMYAGGMPASGSASSVGTRIVTKTITVTASGSGQVRTVTKIRTLWYTRTYTRTETWTEYRTVTVTTPRGPYVILVDAHWQDHRPFLGSPELILTGYLVNIGGQPAYNVVLHVTFYQGNVVTKKDIIIGTIGPYGWYKLDEHIGYSGSAITNVEVKVTWG